MKDRKKKSVVDVRDPHFQYDRDVKTVNLGSTPVRQSRRKKRYFIVATFGAIGVLLVSFLFFVGLRTKQSSDFLLGKGRVIEENISASLEAFDEFEPEEARSYLEENTRLLEETQEGRGSILETLSGVIPILQDSGSITKNLVVLNANLLALADTLSGLQQNGLQYFIEDGPELIGAIEQARDFADNLVSASQKIKNTTTHLKKISSLFSAVDEVVGNPYLIHGFSALSIRETLNEALAALKTDKEQRLIIVFVDGKEHRPGGGVIKQLVEVYFKNGQMIHALARNPQDIIPDQALKTEPPAEIRGGTYWNFSDAAWFFDYPESAETIRAFLEAQENGSTAPIAGVVMTTVQAFENLAELSGTEIQLADASLLLNHLALLNDEKKEKFGELVSALVEDRGLLFYTQFSGLESFFGRARVDGKVFQSNQDFWGMYVGLAYGDVYGAGDSPLENQMLSGKIDIDGNGNALANLSLDQYFARGTSVRKGTREGFLQIFTAPGTELIALSGNNGSARSSGKRLGGDEEDNVLRRFEAAKVFLKDLNAWSANAFGAIFFESYPSISTAGESRVRIRYQTPPRPAAPGVATGSIFKVVLERQMELPTKVSLRVFAPFGYVWKESGGASFLHEAEQMPGRVEFILTLEKN